MHLHIPARLSVFHINWPSVPSLRGIHQWSVDSPHKGPVTLFAVLGANKLLNKQLSRRWFEAPGPLCTVTPPFCAPSSMYKEDHVAPEWRLLLLSLLTKCNTCHNLWYKKTTILRSIRYKSRHHHKKIYHLGLLWYGTWLFLCCWPEQLLNFWYITWPEWLQWASRPILDTPFKTRLTFYFAIYFLAWKHTVKSIVLFVLARDEKI